MYLSLSTIAISLVGRAAIDKFIALGGGPDLLASWAQLQSVMDLVSGAAVAGVAPGLSVLVAQSAARDSHGNLLLTGMALGLGLGLPVLISIVFFHVLPWNFSAYPWLKGWLLPPEWVVAAIAGWLSIGMSMLNAYLIGARRQRAICGLAVFMAAAGIGIAASPHRRRRAIDVSPEISKLSGRREHRQTVPARPPRNEERAKRVDFFIFTG